MSTEGIWFLDVFVLARSPLSAPPASLLPPRLSQIMISCKKFIFSTNKESPNGIPNNLGRASRKSRWHIDAKMVDIFMICVKIIAHAFRYLFFVPRLIERKPQITGIRQYRYVTWNYWFSQSCVSQNRIIKSGTAMTVDIGTRNDVKWYGESGRRDNRDRRYTSATLQLKNIKVTST